MTKQPLGNRHRIEASVHVYLIWNHDTQEWDIDPVCLDNWRLDGAYPTIACEEMEEDSHDESGCQGALNEAINNTDAYLTAEMLHTKLTEALNPKGALQ